MAWPLIAKGNPKRSPNLGDYEQARQDPHWETAARPNIAVAAADDHVLAGRGDHVALRCIGNVGVTDITYRQLSEDSGRFAGVLQALAAGPGSVVATLLERGPNLHAAALGAMKAGAVFCPLFAALGPEPVRVRLALGRAAVLVTTVERYRRTVAPLRHMLPDLRHVLVVDGDTDACIDLAAAMRACAGGAIAAAVTVDTPATLHFTSGTTGSPKGAVHVHGAATAVATSARLALDLCPEDVFWCTADVGWVTGTMYGILAPLLVGATSIVNNQDFDATQWYAVLAKNEVSVFYTTPTAIHRLRRSGAALARTFRFPALRHAASVGEPLDPEAVVWGQQALEVPFHDTWWQTETGSITIANFPAMPIKPGSMGRPMPGVEAAIVRRLGDTVTVIDDPHEVGEIAVRRGSLPSLFSGYVGDPGASAAAFAGDWYLTGDFARRDTDGYFWFFGRKDDVIKSSGHLIGAFEIEAVLMDHPAIAEAAVIGRPDSLAEETVVAYVALNPGFDAGEALRRELLASCGERLGPAVAPTGIQFLRELPKTSSGKILRRRLRQHDRGIIEAELPSPLADA